MDGQHYIGLHSMAGRVVELSFFGFVCICPWSRNSAVEQMLIVTVCAMWKCKTHVAGFCLFLGTLVLPLKTVTVPNLCKTLVT